MMVEQAVNVSSLMEMTLVLRARRMMVTTPPPLHSQVSPVNLCVCVHVCKCPCYVGCVHECAAIINIPLSAHCMPCSCHMSSVQSRSLTMSSHTHHVSATCVVHSVLASPVHSLCTSAADPLSDSEGMRRAATGECDVVVWHSSSLFPYHLYFTTSLLLSHLYT